MTDAGPTRFAAERIEPRNVHGTGCVYSAAITAGLALGDSLPEAVEEAKRLTADVIRRCAVPCPEPAA